MELVLKDVDRKDFLDGVDERKSEERKKGDGAVCNLTIYDPTSSSKEVADRIVLKRLEELKKTKKQDEENETVERGKFNNALTFTDIPATIKEAGFHSDGSPRLAIAGLFDKEVRLVHKGEKFEYHSSLRVEFGSAEIDEKFFPCFWAALMFSVASLCTPIVTLSWLDYVCGISRDILFGTLFGSLSPIICLIVYVGKVSRQAMMELSPGNCIKIKCNISTTVPSVSECVLEEICKHGKGPFAILFEVSEGWQEIKPDPVILRVITIGDKQFFEPVIGYDMTPLEKSSLVET